MRHVTPPCSDKTSPFKSLPQDQSTDQARIGPDSGRSRLDTLAPLGLAVLVIAALLTIMAARTAHHFDGWKCHPGERTTTNGRELCPPRGRPV